AVARASLVVAARPRSLPAPARGDDRPVLRDRRRAAEPHGHGLPRRRSCARAPDPRRVRRRDPLRLPAPGPRPRGLRRGARASPEEGRAMSSASLKLLVLELRDVAFSTARIGRRGLKASLVSFPLFFVLAVVIVGVIVGALRWFMLDQARPSGLTSHKWFMI